MFMSEGRRERGGRESDGDREIEKLKESDRERERDRSGREGRKGEIQGRKNIYMYLSCLLPLLLLSWLFQTGNTDLLCHIHECSVSGYLTRWSQVSPLPRLVFGVRDGAAERSQEGE